MNHAQLTIENPMTAVPDADFEELVPRPQRPLQAAHRDAESSPAAFEKFRIDGTPALLFFWDGKKVHQITDERLKIEMASMIDNNL